MDDRYITRRFDPPLTACLEAEKRLGEAFRHPLDDRYSPVASIRRLATKRY